MNNKWSPILVFALVVCIMCGCGLPISVAKLRKPDLAKYTTPLSAQTIQDICRRFDLKDDERCRPGKTVYAPDFFPVILAAFERGVSTRDDVKAKLGQYEYGCEMPTYVPSLKLTYYVCSYDLNGDRVFPVGIFYQENDVIWRIAATVGDD
jgi:hypothetical protein